MTFEGNGCNTSTPPISTNNASPSCASANVTPSTECGARAVSNDDVNTVDVPKVVGDEPLPYQGTEESPLVEGTMLAWVLRSASLRKHRIIDRHGDGRAAGRRASGARARGS